MGLGGRDLPAELGADIGARLAIVLVLVEEAGAGRALVVVSAAGEAGAGRALAADDPAVDGAVDLVYMFVLSVIVLNLSFLSLETLASVLIGSTVVCACLVLAWLDIGPDVRLIAP